MGNVKQNSIRRYSKSFKRCGKCAPVHEESNLENLYSKVNKIGEFWQSGKADEKLARYIPNVAEVSRQNRIASSLPRKAYASQTYTDKTNLEFVIELTANKYLNYSTMCLVLPIQFTKKTTKTAQMDDELITVNNFFGHWIKDIDRRRYPDDGRILTANNTGDLYQYSAQQLRYLPKDALKSEKTFLYQEKPVVFTGSKDGHSATSNTAAYRTDANLDARITSFKGYLFKKNYYRIPLELLVDLGLINFAEKTDTKLVFTLERNMNKLFESKEKVTAIPDEPDALIQFLGMPYISYQEISLTQNFDIYFSGILRSRTALRMGVLNSPYQVLFEINAGAESSKALFEGAQSQLEWIKISLVYDKSYQHQTIYDSYDAELAAKFIKNVQLENASSTYSLTGQLEYDYVMKKICNGYAKCL